MKIYDVHGWRTFNLYKAVQLSKEYNCKIKVYEYVYSYSVDEAKNIEFED